MNTDKGLFEEKLSESVLRGFYSVYRQLGYGFLEAVYENSLARWLRISGLEVVQQAPIEVRFMGGLVGEYRADLLVSHRLIVEVKSVTTLIPILDAQLLNYLKATGMPLGLLLNFGPTPTFRRKINSNRSFRVHPRPSALVRGKE